MPSFREQINGFKALVAERRRDVLVVATLTAHESIKVGSPITGAPGQPVDTGNLRNSWQYEFDNPGDPKRATISSNVEYAAPIEDGVGRFGPMQVRSEVGGFHSVKMTVAAFPAIVDDAVQRVTGNG